MASTETATLAPTRKWIAAQVVALAAILTMWATTGAWNVEETVALIGWLVSASTTYLLPNQDTPGGVPTKTVDAEVDAVANHELPDDAEEFKGAPQG